MSTLVMEVRSYAALERLAETEPLASGRPNHALDLKSSLRKVLGKETTGIASSVVVKTVAEQTNQSPIEVRAALRQLMNVGEVVLGPAFTLRLSQI